MHLWIFDHRSTRCSDGLPRLVSHFPVRTLSGLFGEADYPPVNFIPALWRGWHLPIYFYFYKVYLNTLDICFLCILNCVRSGQLLEVSTMLLGVLSPSMFSIFLEEVPKWSANFLNCFRASWRFGTSSKNVENIEGERTPNNIVDTSSNCPDRTQLRIQRKQISKVLRYTL